MIRISQYLCNKLKDVEIKYLIISYEKDMERKFKKPVLKMLTFLHKKFRIIKYSLDL